MNASRLLAAAPLLLAISCASPPPRPGERRPAQESRLSPPLKVVSVRSMPNDRVVALTSEGNAAVSDDGGDVWRPFGPPGRRAGELDWVDGLGMWKGEFLAAATKGIYKSADGRTWTLSVERPRRVLLFSTASSAWLMAPGGQHEAVAGSANLADPGAVTAVAESSTGTLCVASFGKGIFRSDDQGARWAPINQGLDNLDVTALAPLDGKQWLAGTFGSGVYRSNDGRVWAPSSQGLDDVEINALASDGKRVFAGAQRGLFRSQDAGQSWARVTGELARDNVQTLAIDAKGRVFAGTWGNGLYRSVDGGASWTRLWLRDDRRDLLTVALGKNGRLYIGARSGHVYSVLPSGNDWQSLGSPSSSLVHDVAVTPGGTVLAATPYGIYRYGLETGWKKMGAAPFERGSSHLILRSFGFGGLWGGSGFGGCWSA